MGKNLTLNFREFKQKSTDIRSVISDNHIRILIVSVFLLGLWVGTTFFAKNVVISDITRKCIDYIINSEYLKSLIILVAVKSGIVAAIFLSGFSAYGLPVSIGFPCIYGIICGTVNSCIYNTYKLNGVLYSLFIIVPFAVITALIVTALADNAINLSKQLIRSVALGEAGKRGEAKKYIITGIIAISGECLTIILQTLLITNPGNMILSL